MSLTDASIHVLRTATYSCAGDVGRGPTLIRGRRQEDRHRSLRVAVYTIVWRRRLDRFADRGRVLHAVSGTLTRPASAARTALDLLSTVV